MSVGFICVLASVIILFTFLLLLSILLYENIATYTAILLLIGIGLLLVWGCYECRCYDHSRAWLWWIYVLFSLGSISGSGMDKS